MNQILDTGENRKKGTNINTIIKFFAICLIIFALAIIGVIVYKMFNKSNSVLNKKPVIEINSNLEEKFIDIKITDDQGIRAIKYTINNKETEVEVNGELEKELKINLTSPKNSLKISVEDSNGEVSEHEELFEVTSQVDINFEVQEEVVKVSITSKNKISYITYRWDNKEETKEEVNDDEYTFLVNTPSQEGKYELTVNVVDKDNNTMKETKPVIVDEKPTIEITRTDEDFVIHAEDDEQLVRAQIIINEEEIKEVNINSDKWDYKIPFKEEKGETRLILIVYNINEISEMRMVKVDTSKFTNE